MQQWSRLWCVVIVALLGTGPGMASADAGRMRPLHAVQDDVAFGTDDIALVALHEGCDNQPVGLTWSGSGVSIDGAVHANGPLQISGSHNTVTGTVTSGCPADISGQSNALGSGASQADRVVSPVNIQAADFPCDFAPPEGDLDRSGPWWEGGTSQGGRLRDGVYCAEGRLKLASSGVTGTVTFIVTGPEAALVLAGSDVDLHPHEGAMLAYSEGATGDAIRISGSGGTWRGIIYAPNGEMSRSGSGGESPSGLIIGDTVTISGSGWTIRGLPAPPMGTILVRVYACPVARGDAPTDFNWFAVCTTRASEGYAFAVSAVGSNAPQTDTTDVTGEVRFGQLPVGTYRLTAVDSVWCHATSDSVNPQGEIDLEAGEQANVWIFYCAAGKE